MNEEILIEKIKYLTSIHHSTLVERCIYLEDEIDKLQSNWNSLREWLISYRTNIENPDFYEEGIIDCIDEILDKMNELEGNDNN